MKPETIKFKSFQPLNLKRYLMFKMDSKGNITPAGLVKVNPEFLHLDKDTVLIYLIKEGQVVNRKNRYSLLELLEKYCVYKINKANIWQNLKVS